MIKGPPGAKFSTKCRKMGINIDVLVSILGKRYSRPKIPATAALQTVHGATQYTTEDAYEQFILVIMGDMRKIWRFTLVVQYLAIY